jgi:AcrR family transcriptional regulator
LLFNLLETRNVNEAAKAKTDSPSPRVQRRQERTRQSILDAATERFSKKSVGTVSVEEIIEAADVSRGTFYKLFKHKEEVLSEILRPLIELYGAKLAAIESTDPWEIIDQIIDVYIQVWRAAPAAFSLSQKDPGESFRLLEESHRPVMTHMRRLFKLIEPHGILRADQPDESVALMARSAVVILRTFDGNPEWEQLFTTSMRGLLLKKERPSN